MIKNDSAFDFSVFGKVDLKALFEEWKEDEEAADYPEPLDNWHLKHSYVYVNGICALLFENTSDSELTWTRWFFPVITTDESLREIDLYAQDCLRFLIRGKRTKARFDARYEDLKRLGYRSLVNEYYKKS